MRGEEPSDDGAMMRAIWFALFVLATFARVAPAHESRPGYLELRETTANRFDVLWKQPAQGEMRLKLDPVFPPSCRVVGVPAQEAISGAILTRFTLACEGGLAGKEISIAGLEATLTDVLVRVHYVSGAEETHLVRPIAPSVIIGGASGGLRRAATFVQLGVEHILRGLDHLLFVLGLLLIVKNRWMLLKTISSFTLAHSITLAIATLGYARAPTAPLNAAIAFSILFLGPEIVRCWRGETSLTIRHPWVVAFAFGLLHGFGFASGLTTMGLPRVEIPLALLSFNVGVEAGQLTFVALVLLLERSFRVLEVRWPRVIAALPGYAVGSLGACWAIGRTLALVGGAQ